MLDFSTKKCVLFVTKPNETYNCVLQIGGVNVKEYVLTNKEALGNIVKSVKTLFDNDFQILSDANYF